MRLRPRPGGTRRYGLRRSWGRDNSRLGRPVKASRSSQLGSSPVAPRPDSRAARTRGPPSARNAPVAERPDYFRAAARAGPAAIWYAVSTRLASLSRRMTRLSALFVLTISAIAAAGPPTFERDV